MLKSKFFDIVSTFTPAELRSFRNFVRSPFHNTNKNVIKVVELVKKYFPNLNDEHLLKENVFKKLYPGKKYNDTVMRILLSDLLKLSEEYLAYINFTHNSGNEIKFLLEELSRRKLNSLFDKYLKYSKQLIKNDGLINVKYFLNLFEIETSKVDHMIATGRQPESAENVLMQGEYLVKFFIVNFLNIAHELEVHKDVFNMKFEKNIVEEFLKYFDTGKFIHELEKNKFEDSSVLMIYYYMHYSAVHPDDDEVYFRLKDLIFENFSRFSKDEKFNLFIILESICTSKTMREKNFFEEQFDLYKRMLTEKVYKHTEDEYFQQNLFRNIYYTAVFQKEYDWAEKFIEKYISELQPENRENAKHLAFAYINFGRSEFEKALKEVSEVKYENFVIKFDIRLLTLKIYYELRSFESALSLIDTFSHFLSNNKNILPNQKEGFGNFLKYLKQMIRIKTGELKKDRDEMISDINSNEKVISKQWLIEKAEELK